MPLCVQLPLYRESKSLRQLSNLGDLVPPVDLESLGKRYSTVYDIMQLVKTDYSLESPKSRHWGYASVLANFGHAMSVTTFDDKLYFLNGNCQYLLARDFLHKDFTVVLNYYKSDIGILSIIFTDQNNRVEIKDGVILIKRFQSCNLNLKIFFWILSGSIDQ